MLPAAASKARAVSASGSQVSTPQQVFVVPVSPRRSTLTRGMDGEGEVTRLLRRASAGDHNAESRLLELVYPRLRGMAGRYLNGVDQGPTGPIEIMFDPGAGKPMMFIERSSMINGWFSVMMLSIVGHIEVIGIGGELGSKRVDLKHAWHHA